MSETRWLLLEPQDVWVFRDGRPFDAGEQRAHRSVFPPFPPTVQGALRAAVLAALCDRRVNASGGCRLCGARDCKGWEAIGRDADEPPFTIGPALPIRDGKLLWPAPLDLLLHESSGRRLPALARPIGGSPRTDLPVGLRPVGVRSPDRYDAAGGWLHTTELQRVLRGEALVPESHELLDHEARTGIALGPGRTAKDGMIYSVDTLRLRPGVGLAVRVRGVLPRLDGTAVQFGGEGRMALVREIPAPALPEAPAEGTRLKLSLASPARFGGWRPPEIDGLSLVGAAVGRPEAIGGWNLAAGGPRPLESAVPAGSVFFYEEKTGGAAVAAAKKLHLESIGERGRSGFGIMLAGGW